MQKSRARSRGTRAVLSLKSASELSLARDPIRAGARFFLFCGARSNSSGLSLSLLFRSPLLSTASSLACALALRGFSSPPCLLYLIPTVMHFPAALFTCFRPSTSVLESPREHSPVHLSSSQLVKEASVENHCAPRRSDRVRPA